MKTIYIICFAALLAGCQTEPLLTYWGGHIETPDSVDVRLMYVWDSSYSPVYQVYQSMDYEADYVLRHDSVSVDTIRLLRCYDAYIEYYFHKNNVQEVDTFRFVPVQDSLYIFGREDR